MANFFNENRSVRVEHRRAPFIAKGHAAGGAVASKGYAAGGAVSGTTASGGGLKAGGKVSKHRADRARGGRTKKGGHKTIVNVISHGGPPAPPAGLAAGAGPAPLPMAGPAPMPPRPMVPPPGVGAGPGGPPMPPPGMPMRKRGGRVAGATAGDGTKPAPTGGGGDGPSYKEGIRAGTKVTHSGNKGDGKDIGRGKVVTYARGGSVAEDDRRSPPSGRDYHKGRAETVAPMGLDASNAIGEEKSARKEHYKKGGGVGQTPANTGTVGKRLVKFWAGGSVGKKAGGAVGPLYSRNAPMGPEFEGGAGGGEARLEKAKRAKSHYKAA